jgi:hypothetical protein
VELRFEQEEEKQTEEVAQDTQVNKEQTEETAQADQEKKDEPKEEETKYVHLTIEAELSRPMYNELMRVDENQDQKKSSAANHLFIFADNSYSMQGDPFKNLQKAMHNLTDMLFDENGDSIAFETIQTIYYNSSMDTQTTNSKDAYLKYIKDKRIQGATDFI